MIFYIALTLKKVVHEHHFTGKLQYCTNLATSCLELSIGSDTKMVIRSKLPE